MLFSAENCSSFDFSQRFPSSVMMQRVLSQVAETWNVSLIIVGTLAIIQLLNAGFSCVFVRWLLHRTQRLRTLQKSEPCCGCRSTQERETNNRSSAGCRQPKRRASAEIAVSSTDNMTTVMTSYCGTWSGRPPQHHVRFSSTIEVLPPSALAISGPQDFSSVTRGNVGLGGVTVSSRTFGSAGVRLTMPAESKV